MKYKEAPDLKERLVDVVKTLRMDHIDLERIECLRSFGSSTKRTIARCHALGKVLQKAMKVDAFYTIEFLERFDRHFPLEWFGHLTFADAVHPEQANRRFNRWWRVINCEAFGKRYREHGEGAYCPVIAEAEEARAALTAKFAQSRPR